MRKIKLFTGFAVISIIGFTSYIMSNMYPSIAGILGALCLYLIIEYFFLRKYGHLKIASVFSKKSIQRLGILPGIMLFESLGILFYGLIADSFIPSFLGATFFTFSFILNTLVVIAGNQSS